ncbi:MAG: SDR family NAD(P)-dependent oxidoreductase [Segniliparus sp.]|uniref:SDR family NAD(P)-dependent oxidoreductase n=1 Tax=Segniliparus sp. TaxID=2804064 RepID=UPI003F310544
MTRLIVVTGASAGIGKATAQRFVGNGDKVLLVSRRADRLAAAAEELAQGTPEADVGYLACDMSDPGSAARLKEHVVSLGVPIHALVCCVGSAPGADSGSLTSVLAEWREAYEANVLSAVIAVEGLGPLVGDGGSIVLYSSIAAYRGASSGTGAYGAAKAALHAYVHALAARLGGRGITVNAIAPGYIADTEFFGEGLPAAREAMLVRQTLLGRPGRPGDVAGLAFYLCSPDGAYITSQIIQINGGSGHGV